MSSSTKKDLNKVYQVTNSHPIILKIILLFFLVSILFACWRIGFSTGYESVNEIPFTEEQKEKIYPKLSLTTVDQEIEPVGEYTSIDLNTCGDRLEILEGGNYFLSGNMSGTILIDTKDQRTHLFLNGASISAKNGPAIIVEHATKVVITLVDDTENTIKDSGKYTSTEKYNACIYSESDLTFNGTGSLEVTGLYKDAIRSKDILKIVDGEYRIHSKRTALQGNDGIHICGGSIFIGSEKYGLKTTKSGNKGRGSLAISGGSHSIVAGRYAFVTKKTKAIVYLFDCKLQLNSVISDFKVKGPRVIEAGCIQ